MPQPPTLDPIDEAAFQRSPIPPNRSPTALWLGASGSVVLFLGVFAPLVSLPFVGSVNYFQNGQGDGVFLIALAVASLVLTIGKVYKGLWATGILALVVPIYTLISLQTRLSDARSEMESKLSGNPFRGIADTAMQSVQIQWGWAVVIVGAGLLIAAAVASRQTRPN